MSLYEPVHARFERFCQARAYGQTDWKDLMQDAVVVAFNRLNELKNPDAFLSFLCGIAIRLLSNSNRKKKEDYCSIENFTKMIYCAKNGLSAFFSICCFFSLVVRQ